ncbi:MAG: hypothetical protein Fur007_16710 [Rhodoferax sp.]
MTEPSRYVILASEAEYVVAILSGSVAAGAGVWVNSTDTNADACAALADGLALWAQPAKVLKTASAVALMANRLRNKVRIQTPKY